MKKNHLKMHTFYRVSTVLLFFLVTTFFIYSINNLFIEAKAQRTSDAQKVKVIIEDEVLSYVFGLQGAKGAIVVDGFKADPLRFHDYAKSREYFNNFSGAIGFGFIRYVKSENLKSYALKNSNKFKIRPYVEKPQHMIVELLEPAETNKNAFGFDISFEKNRFEAALKAALSGKAILTKKIVLTQSKNKKDGFLYLLPIYDTISTPATENERMKHLIGWSFSPIELDVLISKIAHKLPPDINVLLQIDEGSSPIKIGEQSAHNLFFNGNNSVVINTSDLNWTVYTTSSLNEIEYEFILITLAYIFLCTLLGIGAYYLFKVYVKKEKQLLEKTRWLDAIIKSAGHSIIATNAEGVILTFNPTAEKILGYTAQEVVKKHNPGLFHDPKELIDRAEKLSLELGRTIEPNFEVFVAKALIQNSDTNDWTYIKKNGERISIRLCVTAIYNSNDTIVGYLGIAEDLTREIEMSKLIDSQQAQMIERSKMSLLGEMAGGIAHEINTPLAIIVTLSSQLARDKENAEIHNKLLKIKETSERINKIVKGLRLYSRNSEHDPVENVNLFSLIELTIDLCRQKIFHSQVTIKINIDNQLTFLGRPTEISQVILNLISNSIDSIDKLDIRWINLDATVIEKRILISVIDSGFGITPDIVEKMMNPFFTTKDVGKGTGLGLSISKSIIEMHGGRIYYDDKCENTKFVIELPLSENE